MNQRDWLLVIVAGMAGLQRRSAALAAPPTSAGASTPVTGGTPVAVTREMLGAGAVQSGVTLPAIPPVTGSRRSPVSSWGKPLPYPIIIADRRNTRLIEVTPDQRIVWEFPSPDLKIYRGNEDVNFSPDGRLLAVNEEDNYDIHIVDYDRRALVWTYGGRTSRAARPACSTAPTTPTCSRTAHSSPPTSAIVACSSSIRARTRSSQRGERPGSAGTNRRDTSPTRTG